MKPIKTALISVFHKNGITEFVQQLLALGVETIYASGKTAIHLTKAGINVIDVAKLVGGGPILNDRVKTLSRKIHAGLLARYTVEDEAELARLGIPRVDLVCVDLYPLQQEIAKPDCTLESVTEQTDIGGPAMLRSAAKGRRVVICDPNDRQKVIEWMKAGQPDHDTFVLGLCAKAEFTVAQYCAASAMFLGGDRYDFTSGEKVAEGKGENGPQGPSIFYDCGSDDPLAHSKFVLIQGNAPGHINRRDYDRSLQTITHAAAAFELNFGKVPFLAFGAKHGNPCGGSFSDDTTEAIKKMLEGDLQAIFGGIVILNFPVDEKCAETLIWYKVPEGQPRPRRKLDGIIAPGFTEMARVKLQKKSGTCRLIENPALLNLGLNSLDTGRLRIPVRKGYLKQENYLFVLDLRPTNKNLKVFGNDLDENQKANMLLAYAVCATSNSNTISIVNDGGKLIGNGEGQQSRVRAARLAIFNATDSGHDVVGSTACSDSFFPKIDGPEILIKAGVNKIFATSGSVRDNETIELCQKHNVTLLMMPDAMARMFFLH